MIRLIKIFFLLIIIANTAVAQQTDGPFQFNLKVHRKNINRTDCFYNELNFNKPGKFQITVYNYAMLNSLNIRKINIFTKPVGSDANCEKCKGVLPFIKYFEFKIQPIHYNKTKRILKVQIDYTIDEFIKFKSNSKKQIIERSFLSIYKNIPLGKPFALSEINSTDSLHFVTIEIYNNDIKSPIQMEDDRISQIIPADLLKIENFHLRPINWRILHLVTDEKIDQKFWLDEKVAWALFNKTGGKNFSYQTLTSKIEYIFPEKNKEGNIELITIFIPRKIKGRTIEFTFLLFTNNSPGDKNSSFHFQKDISIDSDEPIEIEVEFSPISSFRIFFYITAYFNEDLKAKFNH